jgi:hypothetical protein
VHSYTSGQPGAAFDGFVELKVRIDISPEHPVVTIIPSGPARNASGRSNASLKVRLKQLLDRANPDILRHALAHGSVAVMMGASNLQQLNELRQEPGFDELISIRPNGNTCVGIGNRIGGHIHDRDELGSLHAIELRIKGNLE